METTAATDTHQRDMDDAAGKLRRAASLIAEATSALDGGARTCSLGHEHLDNLVEADALKQLTSAGRKAAYWGRVLPSERLRREHERERVNKSAARAGGGSDGDE